MTMIGRRVTVLGAGVGGLAVARALALRGASVTVLEQADAIREVGAGVQVSPNGAAVLRALGLQAGLQACGTRATAIALNDGFTGDTVLRMDLAALRPQQAYHFVHRADLIALLAAGARDAGVDLRLLHKGTGVNLDGPRPVVTTTQGDCEADLLIGADGLHSVTRVALNGPADPFFTRQVAWRALIPCAPDAPPLAEVHMGPGRHLVSYPLRGGTLRNIVAVEERNTWVEESWSLRDDPMDLRLAFADFAPRVRGWLDQVQDVWLWGLFRHPVAKVWQRSLPAGGVAILGDAAHPTLPFLAQGASMALEDAWVLADALDGQGGRVGQAGQGGPDWQGGLAAYQAARIGRTSRVVAAANGNARAYHLRGVQRGIAHAALRLGSAIAPGLALRRFDWLYDHDVTR